MAESNQNASVGCNAKVRGPVRTQWPPTWLGDRPREHDPADRWTNPAGGCSARAMPLADELDEPASPLAAELSPGDGAKRCQGEPGDRPPADLAGLDDADWFDRLAQTASDSPGERWDDCPEWPDPCPRCGRVLVWWNLRGQTHCLRCDPPDKALRMASLAARLRERHGLPEPAGAAEFRQGLAEARAAATQEPNHGPAGPSESAPGRP